MYSPPCTRVASTFPRKVFRGFLARVPGIESRVKKLVIQAFFFFFQQMTVEAFLGNFWRLLNRDSGVLCIRHTALFPARLYRGIMQTIRIVKNCNLSQIWMFSANPVFMSLKFMWRKKKTVVNPVVSNCPICEYIFCVEHCFVYTITSCNLVNNIFFFTLILISPIIFSHIK